MIRIKILEVNNIDLAGRCFNGYDMLDNLIDDKTIIKQAVITKQSDRDLVCQILNHDMQNVFYQLQKIEERFSISNVFSITSPALVNMKEYKEADIIHFHMFHNTKLSLYSLIKISSEKKVILTLHDPWFLTGRCVHFYDCVNWKNGCRNCDSLSTLFPFKQDNCNDMWNLKKYVFEHLDIDIIVTSEWMKDLIKESPILCTQQNIHFIPFGVDTEKFNVIDAEEAREQMGIPKDHVVLFLRAQTEFKGTEYIVEALQQLETEAKITVLTCDTIGLLNSLKGKYNVIDLGYIEDEEMLLALKACDMFLMPSKGESFGMMAIEAMACSKPVIIFNNTALPSVTFAPECGYLVSDKDLHGLMLAIKDLINNPEVRKRRGALGRKLVEEHYNIKDYNDQMKNLYLSVMKRKHKKLDTTRNDRESAELLEMFTQKDILFKLESYNFDFLDINTIATIDKLNNVIYEKTKKGELQLKKPIATRIIDKLKRGN